MCCVDEVRFGGVIRWWCGLYVCEKGECVCWLELLVVMFGVLVGCVDNCFLIIVVVGFGVFGCYYGVMFVWVGMVVRFLMCSDLVVVLVDGLWVMLLKELFVFWDVDVKVMLEEIGLCDLVIVVFKMMVNGDF